MTPPRSRHTLRRPADLAAARLIAPEAVAALEAVAARYAVAITPDLAELAAREPAVARQFVPSAAELVTQADERADPIGDDAHSPVAGVVHRYPDRVLLKPVLVCPIYCRFCFRREVVGHGEAMSAEQLEAALDYIRAHREIWEVILTGGDPLMLPPPRLAALVGALAAIEHVQVIRLHSRIPVADPARITPALTAALRTTKAVWLAVHCNHAAELTAAARAALAALADAGIPLVSQTVLLRGVNDDAATLDALMRALVANRVKPYYLHHGDLAPGTAHFRTTLAEGQALMRGLRGRASGLCQPHYVLDIPGGAGKVPVGPTYLGEDGTVLDWQGVAHPYPPG